MPSNVPLAYMLMSLKPSIFFYIFVLYFWVVLSIILNYLVATHFSGQEVNVLSLPHHVQVGVI